MAKGFGQPPAVPTRNAAKFLQAFGTCYAKAKGDKQQIQQFLKAHVAKLNEALLAALPMLLPKLVADGKLGDKENVASLFVGFGSSLLSFPLGDRALNLELSIAAYQSALKVFTQDAFPEKWAMTQNNLGNA